MFWLDNSEAKNKKNVANLPTQIVAKQLSENNEIFTESLVCQNKSRKERVVFVEQMKSTAITGFTGPERANAASEFEIQN